MSRQRTIYVSGVDPSRGSHVRPTNPGFERFMWYFMRLSGLALVILALGHMILMHVLTQEVSFDFVRQRWSLPFWRIYDFLLLVLALIHGVNGTRVVIGDFFRRGGLRNTLIVVLAGATLVWLVLGMVVIIGFDPNTAGASAANPFAK